MYYGFNFKKRNSGGLGAIIHDVLLAYNYAEQQNMPFGFIKDGYDIPRLNGSIIDTDIPDKTWHSYFTSFPIIDEKECLECWPQLFPNKNIVSRNKEEYHKLLTKICHFQPHVYDEITALVKSTPFNKETDIVVHIRHTDKLTEVKNFLPIEIYIKECEYALKHSKLTRIYVCTDVQSTCETIKNHFKGIDVVWDNTESTRPLQELRWANKLNKSESHKETMTAFKNLFIMKDSKYLIGGRMSYFFRIGELLGYPNKCVNLQDTDKFGIAPYSEVNYAIRPFKARAFSNFINPLLDTTKYTATYNETGIVNIPLFVSLDFVKSIQNELNTLPWWHYSVNPNNNVWGVKEHNAMSINISNECLYHLEKKEFVYRFKKCSDRHYETCCCIGCKLNDTAKSFPVTDMLCKILGYRNLIPTEVFVSNYSMGDFLSMHSDKNKGDIAVTFSLTCDWHPTYGGILNFCDDKNSIFKSVVPDAGSVNIFKLDKEKGLNHFVSCVNVNKSRYTLTAWYSIEN